MAFLLLSFSVDASSEPSSGLKYGRLVNHGLKHERNAKMIVKEWNEAPVLCLYATKDIQKGTEILYDYGVDESELPWMKVIYT